MAGNKTGPYDENGTTQFCEVKMTQYKFVQIFHFITQSYHYRRLLTQIETLRALFPENRFSSGQYHLFILCRQDCRQMKYEKMLPLDKTLNRPNRFLHLT